ncbi:MAG TPA: permease, partial [Burkholderiaceae bacterium]|nr:permease [Burkholderiaceae bacterium]
MTHSKAVALMVLVTLMWSIAGVVTRHLEAARAFEITFWRSGFTVLALSVALSAMRGTAWWRDVWRGRWPLWVSGLCWSVM